MSRRGKGRATNLCLLSQKYWRALQSIIQIMTYTYTHIHKHPQHTQINGLVERPVSLTMDEIIAMPSITIPVTLVCAGNRCGSVSVCVCVCACHLFVWATETRKQTQVAYSLSVWITTRKRVICSTTQWVQ